ncbi:hypothetical protein [Hyperthermus butylicus]|uniref:Membrane protein 6-pyruvoyl-tetrahydropterin synthase-related domain-containing protein n=1 Tax=Hyperthermus butylicus (strain DSM 5456 / JCM 9403 / PLM1-5) TaxID=415426 RepID=A2BLZ2_HYPBU|nr:hypothetical protein [Hyperthermus butylicus]ABM81003.1 hypothetical protein Hbut_1168 [Hyperthermus butylicus DSM 5456]
MRFARSLPFETVASIAIVLWALILAHPLLTAEGLPSFERGYFHSATIAYYISWAKELHSYGLYTPAWCGGFDLLRFYPPLGLLLIFALGLLAGSFIYGAYLAYFIAIYAFLRAIYSFAYSVSGSSRASLLLALAAPLISGYVSTIAVYWEYTRILGEAFAFLSLASLVKLLDSGDSDEVKRFSIFSALTLLTHLIASLELAILALTTFVAKILTHYRRGASFRAITYLIILVAVGVLLSAAYTAWWLIPALLPFGLQHYLRVKTPLSFKLSILAHSSSPYPPLYEPAVQLPIIVMGLIAVIAYVTIARRAEKLPLYYILAFTILVAVYGQGLRLIPTLGLLMVLGFLDSLSRAAKNSRGRHSITLFAHLALVAFIAAYTPAYVGVYWNSFHTDHTYVYSDEYLVAQFLKENTGEGFRAYLMDGDTFHGNQWINVFSPKTWHALSCFMEGCIYKDYIVYDNLVKNSLSYYKVYNMSKKYCIKYIVVDSKWFYSNPRNVIKMLEEKGLISREPLSSELKYSLIFKVEGVNNCKSSTTLGYYDELLILLLPSRLLGYAISIIAIVLYRKLKKLIS